MIGCTNQSITVKVDLGFWIKYNRYSLQFEPLGPINKSCEDRIWTLQPLRAHSCLSKCLNIWQRTNFSRLSRFSPHIQYVRYYLQRTASRWFFYIKRTDKIILRVFVLTAKWKHKAWAEHAAISYLTQTVTKHWVNTYRQLCCITPCNQILWRSR